MTSSALGARSGHGTYSLFSTVWWCLWLLFPGRNIPRRTRRAAGRPRRIRGQAGVASVLRLGKVVPRVRLALPTVVHCGAC